MAANIKTITITLITTLGLAACGGGGGGSDSSGGGGGTDIDPISSEGFASDESTFNPDSTAQTFTVESTNILALRLGDDPFALPGNVKVIFNDDQSRLTLVFGGLGFPLERVEQTDYYNFSQGGAVARMSVEEISQNQAARMAEMSGNIDYVGYPTTVVYGFDTDPDTIAALTGDVTTGKSTYTGKVLAQYASDPTVNFGEATGVVQITADFTNNTVDGDISIGALDDAQGATTWLLDTAQINGNGFSGTLSEGTSQVNNDTTILSANYDGRFYGTEGDAVGGQFLIELNDDGEEAYIQGAYLADEQ